MQFYAVYVHPHVQLISINLSLKAFSRCFFFSFLSFFYLHTIDASYDFIYSILIIMHNTIFGIPIFYLHSIFYLTFFDIVRFIRKFTNIPCALRCALLTCSPSSKPIILLECSQLNNDDVFAMRIWPPLLQYGLVGLSVWFGHTGTIFDCEFSLRLIPQRFILSLNCEIYEFKQKTF